MLHDCWIGMLQPTTAPGIMASLGDVGEADCTGGAEKSSASGASRLDFALARHSKRIFALTKFAGRAPASLQLDRFDS